MNQKLTPKTQLYELNEEFSMRLKDYVKNTKLNDIIIEFNTKSKNTNTQIGERKYEIKDIFETIRKMTENIDDGANMLKVYKSIMSTVIQVRDERFDE